jgi:hypothetical protein
MPITSRYIFIASMDVAPEKEALLNEVYDTEHVPSILKVPGVISVTRFKSEPFTMLIGGGERHVGTEKEPRYSRLYELESPEVLKSEEWAKGCEAGRWPSEVRPHTRNVRQIMLKPE